MAEKREALISRIEDVIEKGPYGDTWESLAEYPEAPWYRNAKFGIFIHWGVYSVPAFGSEWYPRNMYIRGTAEYDYHRKTFGDHREFGYADFVPLFKAENFDPAEWAGLFREAGARYVMPVAEHHDGFQMYHSELSSWCASKRGPCRDILGELKKEVEDRDMVFAVSSHRAENFWFFGGGRKFDSGLEEGFREPYGWASDIYPTQDIAATEDIYSAPPSEAHLKDWLVRTCELVDRYRPKILWFDWWIQNAAFKPYLKKFAAYYYNRSVEWGHPVAINYKFDAFAPGTAVYDIERGQLSGISPRLWQNDTAVAKNSWGYTENNDFKNPADLIGDLVDIVSKNGCLLLNIGPRADGRITDEDQAVLRAMGRWLKINGEGIYDTTYWHTFGEGPTEIVEGSFTDVNRGAYTSEDIRFTYKAPHVYAHVMKWPESGRVTVRSLGICRSHVPGKNIKPFKGHIADVALLGYEDRPLSFSRDEEGLHIRVEGAISTPYPLCLKVTID